MEIKADGFMIRDLFPEDRFELRKWKDFEDPIFYGYNYSDMTDAELRYWYTSKQFPFRAKYFVALDEKSHMFAYFGIKEINRFTSTSKLGIVMDSSYVSKGFGKKILDLFLDYYFMHLNMRKMILEVNEWNTRALNLYKDLGFKVYGSYYQKFENQALDIDQERYDQVRDSFKEKYGQLYNNILKMSLTKEEYLGGLNEG